jgi:outer membrane exchange protein TraA
MSISRRIALSLAAAVSLPVLTTTGSAQAVNPVVISTPIPAPAGIQGKGTGLCASTAKSPTPDGDFPQGPMSLPLYVGALNAFMEAHRNDRTESVLRTVFDLSNNNTLAEKASYGDFINSVPGTCLEGGCPFVYNDAGTSFGVRFRGFLLVTDDLVNKPTHIGFYADDGVSLALFDKNAASYAVALRPPQVGLNPWRLSNTVTFKGAGFYPVEILYANFYQQAALEMSFFDDPTGKFTDFELGNAMPGSQNLKDAGFSLAKPTQFFQTLSGSPSFADLDKCKQCDRAFAGKPGNGGCDGSYYCNEAALCAPCDTDAYCGPSCAPCGGATRYCINVNGTAQCNECRDDKDCGAGKICDATTHTCQQCQEDKDCPRGNVCEKHVCVVCDTASQCAGNSCNCCPDGSNGKPMQCADINGAGYPACVECTKDDECPSPEKCDKLSGHCVKTILAHSTPDCCGDSCQRCPTEFPFCLPGPVGTACAECRADKDCKEGAFCLSGQCQACTKDRRCGERCTTCGGDTPYCLADRTPESASCVRCEADDQCAGGGTCDKKSHTCSKGCAQSCAPATPYCDGEKCVECYADTQCPCNGTCNLTDHTCSTSCKANVDCLGNEHCKWNSNVTSKECKLGPLPGTECSRGLDQVLGIASDKLETPEICGTPPKSEGGCTASGDGAAGTTEASALGLLAVALLALRRRRAQS